MKASQVIGLNLSEFGMNFGIARVALILNGSDGRKYILATKLPAVLARQSVSIE